MGLVMMSERELNRIEVLSQVSQGRMTVVTAANVLGLSRRQVHRLLKDFQIEGLAALRQRTLRPMEPLLACRKKCHTSFVN